MGTVDVEGTKWHRLSLKDTYARFLLKVKWHVAKRDGVEAERTYAAAAAAAAAAGEEHRGDDAEGTDPASRLAKSEANLKRPTREVMAAAVGEAGWERQ